MNRRLRVAVLGVSALTVGAAIVFAANDTPAKLVALDQNVDAATLARYHHTDQGTRLVPAAWLAAVEKADGSRPFMNPQDLRRLGFLLDDVAADNKGNPFGWPIGFTVSDGNDTGGIAMAGFSCALCHTGQIEYKGSAIRIEGGQANIDMLRFLGGLFSAFGATARDPERKAHFFADAIKAGYPNDRMAPDFERVMAGFSGAPEAPNDAKIRIETGYGRLDALQGAANEVYAAGLKVPSNNKSLDGPVSYPYLWNIWRLSWLEYNGLQPPQATSRNIVEVLGSKATTHIVDPATGALNPEPLRWRTSIQLNNIVWMEKTLGSLNAPTWPAAILGPIDQAKADAGRELFVADCAGCHGIKALPNGMWDVTLVSLSHIGTDPNQATNWAKRTYDALKLGLDKEASAFALDVAVNKIRRQLYADNKTPSAEQEPDVHFEASCGYKARPLIGVWATPAFLHNGSVRTVFDLLSDTRPAHFKSGSREYDPVNLGYVEDDSPDSLVFDTSISGNHNGGHWFTDDGTRSGRIGPKLTDSEKYAIIEFLKSATYDNYPSEKVSQMAVIPCQGDREWARKGDTRAN